MRPSDLKATEAYFARANGFFQVKNARKTQGKWRCTHTRIRPWRVKITSLFFLVIPLAIMRAALSTGMTRTGFALSGSSG